MAVKKKLPSLITNFFEEEGNSKKKTVNRKKLLNFSNSTNPITPNPIKLGIRNSFIYEILFRWSTLSEVIEKNVMIRKFSNNGIKTNKSKIKHERTYLWTVNNILNRCWVCVGNLKKKLSEFNLDVFRSCGWFTLYFEYLLSDTVTVT